MIFNIGGGVAYETPVLNSSYPANVTQLEKVGGSASFSVKIATDGNPASYTYQWYVNDSPVSGATSSSYTKTGLTSAATYSIYCKVTNKAGSVNSRTATLTVQTTKPAFSYSGAYNLQQDGAYHWKLKFLTSGVVNFSHLGCFASGIDVFCVGGGGSGCNAGGGGGFTKTSRSVGVSAGANYTITIGAGGLIGSGHPYPSSSSYSGNGGGSTTAFGVTANGGGAASHYQDPDDTYGSYVYGGNGGSGGGTWTNGENRIPGNGGSDGSAGGAASDAARSSPGSGQGTTTREFGESGATLYSGGGGGGNYDPDGTRGYGGAGGGGNGYAGDDEIGSAGGTNTGGGGGGGWGQGHGYAGGSGIAVIRDRR